ncbi:response regulator [Lutimaribacter sp. EGI FJ00015]|uniref:Response regulator n=1 Tax=Lutimaribacter degradans TaxID=2945989 RepID=A0ACC6A1X5_9RHOB|nr:CheR family methyltransferase [Lutimaribacter sp. EGI FJ00013]MCM2563754.1 response regulator [Lutimaribacter sp. EGI FJ00013]MCO0614939.1 response regulator [Lutimaribacter sp. EGI FJ00015]MCO0637580.1 response regulator [Lutimaribacter sp. EGI FJ00014]
MSDDKPQQHLPVIAIGASAGGLEACRALLKNMPNDMYAAFILVLHLDPTHESMMVDLLARDTGLEVLQASEGMALRSGCLHVIPPGLFLTVAQRVLHLSEPEGGKGVRLPFDVLLRSLAIDARALSGCIVMSGTGTDGSIGVGDIHAAGGLVIAQDPEEAAYPGMPESAIETGFVDRTLATKDMVGALNDFLGAVTPASDPATDTPRHGKDDGDCTGQTDTVDYDALIALVDEYAPQDISLYKRGTIERRIAGRMSNIGLGPNETARYLDILQSDAEERTRLASDLLIHVTSFFRDAAVFKHLSTKAVPSLLKALPPERPLRVWVAGCSTGEEAYSLAITCIEAMEAAGAEARLQILASDVDPEAIATARTGFYSKDIEADVSPERLARFFVAEDNGWRVTSTLRDVIVFTVADLLSDPPFSRIDLVSCRNVLIYLGPEAQKRVVARCCFALRQDGLLLLGSAEMPGQSNSCFALEDKASRLWRRVGKSLPGDLQFAAGRGEVEPRSPAQPPVKRTALVDLCRKILLENYAPAAALLNVRLECLYLLGPTEKYLKITQGHPDPGFVGMLPKALRARFRDAAATCDSQNPVVTISGGRIGSSGSYDIALHAVSAGGEPLLLACFLETPYPGQPAAAGSSDRSPKGQTANLEAELVATRHDLRDALRDLDREVEAHAADAAEALSVNEEFQSTNEELLASKEELQSLNEELTALNSQLQETLERHRTTANDLQNVLYSTDVATLFLDLDLNIRFFTPAARAIFHVIPTDIGRPLSDLAAVSRDDDLAADTRAVLASGDPIEQETEGSDGQWFQRRIQPYRAEADRVEGVVITYVDITERKRNHAALLAAIEEADRATRAKSRFLASASHDLRQPLQSMALLHKLLAPRKRSTEGARLAALLDQTLNSMTAMLDSMLDVNRIESGIVRPDMRPVPIAPLIQRLVDEFGPQCKLKHLKLRSVPSRAWVRTDPQLLEQMLRNLVSNALKYTPKGGILIGCRHKGETLNIHVCDSGIGVAESDKSAIFDAYHQVEKADMFAGQGLGLGLSIVQRLAELMEHPVSMRSTPGKGSTFMISLPVVDADPEALAPPKVEPEPCVSERQTGTILLVEDEEPLRDLLADVLTKEGHKVIPRAGAKDALAWASGDVARPDLLLTDFDLHGDANGLTLAQDLPDILGVTVPTIILTGDITSATMKSIAASPFSQVTKPVLPEVLLAQISDLMLMARLAKAEAAWRAEPSGTSVHVIDDDPIIRETMRRLFEAEGWVVVTYASAEEFLSAPRPGSGACLLVDNLLPGMDGVALIDRLRTQESQLPTVMLTGHGDAAMAVAALKAGASDLIEKPTSAAELLASVRAAMAQIDDGHAQADTRKAAQERFSNLTAREHEILERVLDGKPNKIIAHDLGINQRTVENHRASVMRKTGVESLPALVRLAIAADLQSA